MKRILTLLLVTIVAVMLVGCQANNAGTTDNKTAENKTAASNTGTTVEKALKDVVGVKIKYTADYTITASGTTQTITQAMNLPKFVMVTPQSRSIFDGTNFIVCSNQGGWQCFKMAVQAPQSVDISDKVSQGKVTSTFQGACTVAGETGLKYKIVSEGVESTVCYTLDGILLEMTTQGMSMTATKVSRTVDDSLFTPPAEPKDISQMAKY